MLKNEMVQSKILTFTLYCQRRENMRIRQNDMPSGRIDIFDGITVTEKVKYLLHEMFLIVNIQQIFVSVTSPYNL